MKNLLIIFSLIFLISFTAIIKTSSKKIEEKIFSLNESLAMLKEKYNIVSLENTYLSKPSRLINIMKNDKNIDYIYIKFTNKKFLNKELEND